MIAGVRILWFPLLLLFTLAPGPVHAQESPVALSNEAFYFQLVDALNPSLPPEEKKKRAVEIVASLGRLERLMSRLSSNERDNLRVNVAIAIALRGTVEKNINRVPRSSGKMDWDDEERELPRREYERRP